MFNLLPEILPKDMNEETRSLLWRVLITLFLIVYVFWANGFIENTGHVSHNQFAERQRFVDEQFQAVIKRVQKTESAVLEVDSGIRQLRLEAIRANLFNAQAKLCELHAENGANRDVIMVYEQQVLNLWEEYRTLNDGEYPLKPCTGMRQTQ